MATIVSCYKPTNLVGIIPQVLICLSDFQVHHNYWSLHFQSNGTSINDVAENPAPQAQ